VSEGGCKAVKLEGGEDIIENVKAIISAGIPVVGHLGYTPQSINVFGGHKAQGKTIDTAKKIYRDALLLQKAGVFAVVLECVPYKLAAFISKRLDIPTIGIGSGPDCDGQVLVIHDLTGMFKDFTPKHVKKYAEIGEIQQKKILLKWMIGLLMSLIKLGLTFRDYNINIELLDTKTNKGVYIL